MAKTKITARKSTGPHGVPRHQLAPFEALYGRRCQTPLHWLDVGERWFFGPDVVKEAEQKFKLIQANMKVAQSRQKAMLIRGGDL